MKLQTSLRRKTAMPVLFLIIALGFTGIARVESQCPLTCLGQTQLSLGPDGTGLFTPSMGLAQIPPACANDYTVMLFNVFGDTIPNPVTCALLGQNLTFKVIYTPNGNNCWGQVLIEDKLPPVLNCSGQHILCNESSDPGAAGVIVFSDNCDADPQLLLTDEQIIQHDCDHPDHLVQTISRTWFVRDTSGNESDPCTQVITIERAGLSDVRFPPDRIGLDAIPCDTPVIHPDSTGWPLVFGSDNDPLCKILFTYKDDTLATCPGGFLVNREWTALDCCTSEIAIDTQVIEVVDIVPPVMTCPTDLTISTKLDTCTADFTLPSASVTDACSPGVIVTVTTSWGGIGTGPYFDIPEGGYKVTYFAVDSCGNQASCSMEFTIKDMAPPVAICHIPVRAFLNEHGVDTLFVEDVDAGSFDNCTMVMGQIKLMDEPDSLFRDSILIDCSYIGKDTMVILRITDCWDNVAICMTTLIATDTLPPDFHCPQDTILYCTEFMNYPDIGGVAIASDNCSGHTLFFTDSLDLNLCGVGTIRRLWQASDTYGNIESCEQTIMLIDSTGPQVIWPPDITVSCGQFIEPLYTGEPQVSDDCSLLAIGHTDSLIIVDGGCDTLYRIWRVLDWCSDLDTTYTQRIDLTDPVPIIPLVVPQDVTVYVDDACEIYVPLNPIQTFDECGHYGFITNDSPFADEDGANASGTFPIGVHVVTFTIRDACHINSASMTITVLDTVPPLLLCNDVITCINDDGTFTLEEEDIVLQAFDLCGPVDLTISPSSFTCADVMIPIPVTVTASDPFNNTATCQQILFLINCNQACENLFPGGGVILAGKALRWDDKPMANVPVQVDFGPYSEWYLTDELGQYQTNSYPPGINVKVKMHPIPGDLEGITTGDAILMAQHILGVEKLDWVSQLFAADINESGGISISDLVILRKAILSQTNYFNTGFWRFIPEPIYSAGIADVQASNDWSGVYYLDSVPGSMTNVNFVGLKIGDVTGTTSTFGLSSRERIQVLSPDVTDNVLSSGAIATVPFHLNDHDEVYGLQLTLGFEPQDIEILDVQFPQIDGNETETYIIEPDGKLRLRWDDIRLPLQPGNQPLFELKVKFLKPNRMKDCIWLEYNDMPARLYYADKQEASIALDWPTPHSTTTTEFYFYPPAPNPFTSSLKMIFDLPKEGPVTLQIVRPDGIIVKAEKHYFHAGQHQLGLQDSQLPAPGVYHAMLLTNHGVAIRQIILAGP